ncbi:cysteine hydrolase family protein [Thermodesulfobium sp. 4217-1]|uniref:cysteine hydrolase family protein n=1 Tax=Thermodesulfobium sp. 4217-1 TaxID=3120013 RepID=UPI003221CEA4
MKRALLIIDVQNEYFSGKLPVTYPNDSFSNILKSIDFANENQIPVILIQHTAPQKDSGVFVKGTKEWQIKEEVRERKYKYIIEKNFPDSFANTDLEAVLKRDEIDTVTICGYMTQMCCDTTARQAMHKGFFVEFLSDATGTLDISNYAGSISAEQLHNAILITQAMRFSKVLTTHEWIENIKSR